MNSVRGCWLHPFLDVFVYAYKHTVTLDEAQMRLSFWWPANDEFLSIREHLEGHSRRVSSISSRLKCRLVIY